MKGSIHALAMTSRFSSPCSELLGSSYNTLVACKKLNMCLEVVDVHSITAVVAMPPLPVDEGDAGKYGGWFYVVEKPGHDVCQLGDGEDTLEDDEVVE